MVDIVETHQDAKYQCSKCAACCSNDCKPKVISYPPRYALDLSAIIINQGCDEGVEGSCPVLVSPVPF